MSKNTKKKSETETLFTKSDDKKMGKFKLENLYDDDESFDSIISQCTEDLSLIKKKYYETKAEIKAMYPKLSDNIIEKICFSNFLSFVFESRCSDSEIIYFLSSPATNNINTIAKQYAIAVPKSGCLIINAIGIAQNTKYINNFQGLFISFFPLSCSLYKINDINITITILASSDG